MLCPIRATFVLMHVILVAELAFQLEVSTHFDALELHAFKRNINLVLVDLHFEEPGDAFKFLSLKFLAGGSKLVTVILVE